MLQDHCHKSLQIITGTGSHWPQLRLLLNEGGTSVKNLFSSRKNSQTFPYHLFPQRIDSPPYLSRRLHKAFTVRTNRTTSGEQKKTRSGHISVQQSSFLCLDSVNKGIRSAKSCSRTVLILATEGQHHTRTSWCISSLCCLDSTEISPATCNTATKRFNGQSWLEGKKIQHGWELRCTRTCVPEQKT